LVFITANVAKQNVSKSILKPVQSISVPICKMVYHIKHNATVKYMNYCEYHEAKGWHHLTQEIKIRCYAKLEMNILPLIYNKRHNAALVFHKVITEVEWMNH